MKMFLLFGCCLVNFIYPSEIKIYEDLKAVLVHQSQDPTEIRDILKRIDVRFETRKTVPLDKEVSLEEMQMRYRDEIEQLKEENGFQSWDLLRIFPDHPQKESLREKFLNEHTHDEPEVRFFVEGSGLFFLHVKGYVYSVLCEKGDLISIPENYLHWFDMGKEAHFSVIRFFTKKEGWIPHFTGDSISQKFDFE